MNDASPGVQLNVHPWSSNGLSDRKTGWRFRQHEYSRSCAQRLDVNVDDVRRFDDAVSGS